MIAMISRHLPTIGKVLATGLIILLVAGAAAVVWMNVDVHDDRRGETETSPQATALTAPVSAVGTEVPEREIDAIVEVSTEEIRGGLPDIQRYVRPELLRATDVEDTDDVTGSMAVVEMPGGELPDSTVHDLGEELVDRSEAWSRTIPVVEGLFQFLGENAQEDNIDSVALRIERTTPLSVVEPVFSTIRRATGSVSYQGMQVGPQLGVEIEVPDEGDMLLPVTVDSGVMLHHSAYDRHVDGPCDLLELYIHITPEGFRVSGLGSMIDPVEGCPDDGPTICLANDVDVENLSQKARSAGLENNPESADAKLGALMEAYDWAELYDLVTLFKQDFPAEDYVAIAGDPELPFEMWVRTADLLRYQYDSDSPEEISADAARMIANPEDDTALREKERDWLFDNAAIRVPELKWKGSP